MALLDYFCRLKRRLSSSGNIRNSAAPIAENLYASLFEPVCAAGRISGAASGTCEIAGRKIAYAIQVGFEAKDGAMPRHAGVRGWALDLADFRPIATLCVVTPEGATHRFAPSDARGDALSQVGVPQDKRAQALRCGFAGYLPKAEDGLTFALEVEGQSRIVGTGHPNAPQFLVGRNGWLFLAGDTNDSPAQFTGEHQPTAGWQREWDDYFAAFAALRESEDGGLLCFLIAPSKESIFPDYYPLMRGPKSPLESLMERHGSDPGVFYPAAVLSRLRELSYDRAETHWTHFGARVACQEIMHLHGSHNPPLPMQFELPFQSGDLGWKAVPPVRTYRAIAAWPNPAQVIFDNFVLHHGRIRVTANPNASRRQTCVIFGGSSAEHMERYLTAIFTRVVYVYSAGAWDPEILRHERPDFTIMQSSERFLVRAPAPIIDNAAIVAKKIASGHLTRKEPRETLLAEWTDPSIAFYKEMG